MDIKILQNEKNVFEAELPDVDQSLAQVIAERLNQNPDVEFASYKLEHPIVAHPKLYVRTKKGEAAKLVLSTIAEIKDEVSEFKKQFLELAK